MVVEELAEWVDLLSVPELGARSASLSFSSSARPTEDNKKDENRQDMNERNDDVPINPEQESVCGHVFLLAPTILACMGSSSSSIVRTAVMELLLEADLAGTFINMRNKIQHQRRALLDAQDDIAQLRDETQRLSISSMAGFF